MSKAAELAALIGSQTALSNRNLIINGAMQVAQRGTSETSVTSTQYANAPDRFKVSMTNGGTWTVSQSTTSPEGFSNSYKFDCTAANGSLSSDSNIQLLQRIEGQNLQQLAKGTSGAKSVTVSFYVRTNKTGTYTLELFDRDNTRTFSKTYTVSSADTWEFKSVTFAGDTLGALDNDNAVSLDVSWFLAAGTDFTSGTFSSGWASKTDANRVSSSQVNLADSTSNEWYITGIQLEVGEQATAFEHRSFADELARCQRYYQVTAEATSNYHVFPAQRFSSSKLFFSLPIATSMRGDPQLGSNTTGNIGLVGGNGSENNFALSDVTFVNVDASSITVSVDVSFTPTTGRGYTGYITTGDELQFDAEL